MSLDQKKNAEKMKKMDPKKADQMQRLGMGMGGHRYALLNICVTCFTRLHVLVNITIPQKC